MHINEETYRLALNEYDTLRREVLTQLKNIHDIGPIKLSVLDDLEREYTTLFENYRDTKTNPGLYTSFNDVLQDINPTVLASILSTLNYTQEQAQSNVYLIKLPWQPSIISENEVLESYIIPQVFKFTLQFIGGIPVSASGYIRKLSSSGKHAYDI